LIEFDSAGLSYLVGRRKNMKKRKGPTTAYSLIARFDAGKSALDYFDAAKGIHSHWGGAWNGAGRKPSRNVRLQLSLPAAALGRIREIARREPKAWSAVVAERFLVQSQ
jgi:hypothetical protein